MIPQLPVWTLFYIIYYTDHKPLQGLLNESKAIPILVSARIQRWALTLATYQYKIVYKKGSEISNARWVKSLTLASSITEYSSS